MKSDPLVWGAVSAIGCAVLVTIGHATGMEMGEHLAAMSTVQVAAAGFGWGFFIAFFAHRSAR